MSRTLAMKWLIAAPASMLAAMSTCTPAVTANRFDSMPTVDLTIKSHNFKAWVADDASETTAGLMYVTPEELAPLPDGTERSMIFVFREDKSKLDGFWMKNVPIPLDIAFISADGTIVTVLTMAAYDESVYRPTAGYRYTLECNANTYSKFGIVAGDVVPIPHKISTGS